MVNDNLQDRIQFTCDNCSEVFSPEHRDMSYSWPDCGWHVEPSCPGCDSEKRRHIVHDKILRGASAEKPYRLKFGHYYGTCEVCSGPLPEPLSQQQFVETDGSATLCCSSYCFGNVFKANEWDNHVFKREYMGEFVSALHCSECKRFARKHEINKMASERHGRVPDEWCCVSCYKRLMPAVQTKEDLAPIKKLGPRSFSVSGPGGMELTDIMVPALKCHGCNRHANEHEVASMLLANLGGELPSQWCCPECAAMEGIEPMVNEKPKTFSDSGPGVSIGERLSKGMIVLSTPNGSNSAFADAFKEWELDFRNNRDQYIKTEWLPDPGRRAVITGRRHGKTEATRHAKAAWESVHGPDPARTCADCGGEMWTTTDSAPFCPACSSEHEAARRVAEEETPTEPAPPPETEVCSECQEPFDAYRRKAPVEYSWTEGTCTNCNEQMIANVETSFGEPERVRKVYDEPEPRRSPITAEARWHCEHTAVTSTADWEE